MVREKDGIDVFCERLLGVRVEPFRLDPFWELAHSIR
jgi:hypothetical protein